MSFSDLFRKAPREAGRARPGASRLPRARRRTPGPRGRFSGPKGPGIPHAARGARKTGFTARRGRGRASLYRAPRGCAAYLSTEELAPAPRSAGLRARPPQLLNEGLRAWPALSSLFGPPRPPADAPAGPRATPSQQRTEDAVPPQPKTTTRRRVRVLGFRCGRAAHRRARRLGRSSRGRIEDRRARIRNT